MNKKILPDISRRNYESTTRVKRDDYVKGWVYLVEDLHGDVKIGLSRKPEERHKALAKDYGNLRILAVLWVVNMKLTEDRFLARYRSINIHKAGYLSGYTEWHRCGYFKKLELIASLHLQAFDVNFPVIWLFLRVLWRSLKILCLAILSVFSASR